MISTSGIWSHATAQSMSPTLTPMDSSSDGGSSSTGDSATISANDFLTLLVTEMQNQDPTADTDPNEYINQLVNVNSLEQLININQTLSTALGGSSGATGSAGTTTGGDAVGPSNTVQQALAAVGGNSAGSMSPSPFGATSTAAAQPVATHLAPGNLSIPSMNPAAQRVAQSLSGH
jgi:flagellar basal-body rod modification protein FlgD